jgi:TPR repeat protein
MKNKLIKKYNSLCDSGDMEICASFGIMYTEYNIIIQNESKISKKERLEISKKLLTKACNNGNLKGCYGLTDYEFYPSPAYKNKKRLELIKSICNQGYIPACTSYGFSCQIAQGKEKAKEAKI